MDSLSFSGIPIVKNLDFATKTLSRNVGKGIPPVLIPVQWKISLTVSTTVLQVRMLRVASVV